MNTKLFFSGLMITFGMIFWMFFQPGSLTFIGIRVAIAFVSVILMFFSSTWNEKGKWKSTALIILITLGIASLGYLAISYGLLNYTKATIISCLLLGISILMYIKYLEPRILKKKNVTPVNDDEEQFDCSNPQSEFYFYDDKGNRMKMS